MHGSPSSARPPSGRQGPVRLLAAPQVGPQRDVAGSRTASPKANGFTTSIPAVSTVPSDGQSLVSNPGVAPNELPPMPYALESVQPAPCAVEQVPVVVEPVKFAVEHVSALPSTPTIPLNGQFMAPFAMQNSPPMAQQMPPNMMPAPQQAVRSNSVSRIMTPRGYTVVQQPRAPPMNPMMQPMVTGSVEAPAMVAMPTTVLQHIDSVVTEMEKELSEIRAYEQRQEACEVRQAHLNEIRALVAERLLNTGDEEHELREVRAEVNRLSILEADHLALKRQVLDLEQQRSTAEREREELLRIRAALEAECEARLNELRTAADAVEHEKRRAQIAEESANERVRQAAMEARTLQEKLLEAEAISERERRISSEALEAQSASDRDLRALEGSSAAVLNDCRALQLKIKEAQSERDEVRVRIVELEAECASLQAIGETRQSQSDDYRQQADKYRTRSAELENKLVEMEGSLNDAHAKRKQQEEHISGHYNRITDLERALNEKHVALLATEDNHMQKHDASRGRIATLEQNLLEASSEHETHQKQHNVNRNRIAELEQELLGVQGVVDTHAKQNASHRQKIAELEQRLADAMATESTHTRQHHTHRTRIQDLEQELLTVQNERDNHARQAPQHRARLVELERQSEEWRLAEDSHTRQHGTNKARIAELERLLQEAQTQEGQHTKHHHHHRTRIAELEQTVVDLTSTHETHVRQGTTHRQRIAELERELEQTQSNESNHHRQHGVHRSKIMELEQRLAEAERGHESQLQSAQRHVQSHRERVQELEKALADAQGSTRLQSVHAKRVTELEDALAEAQSEHGRLRTSHAARLASLEQDLARAHQDHGEKHQQNQSRISALQQEIANANAEHGEKHQQNHNRIMALQQELAGAHSTHNEKHSLNVSRIMELERALEEKEKVESQIRAESESHRVRVEELHKVHASHRELEERVVTLAEELEVERKNLAVALAEQEEMKSLEASRGDIAKQLEMERQQLQQKISELTVELQQAKITITEYEERQVHRQKKKSLKMLQTASRSTSARASLYGELKFDKARMRESAWCNIAPLVTTSGDPFILKVREATRMVCEALRAANAAHLACIDGQVRSALEAQMTGRDARDGIQDYNQRLEIESDRRAAADQVEAASHDLKALKEELAIQHQLSTRDSEEITSLLEIGVSKCSIELALLQVSSALGEVPDAVVLMLLDTTVGSATEFDEGFSPMHWAAKQGRRDIIEYLLALKDGGNLLAAQDKYGCQPVSYASELISQWLQEEMSRQMSTSLRREFVPDQAPPIRDLPEPYLRVLQQIQQYGWNSMNWRDGYSMLHWAASKGRGDVCEMLARPPIDADLDARDREGRTAEDVAREAGYNDIVDLLRRIRTGISNP